ncbi:MAG: hypothetical protein JO139_02170 [Alphaproteobacteria bacterium]|nr:hypothetical protein [Alphaproteobacteria bacterium]
MRGAYDQRVYSGDATAGADQRVDVQFADESVLVTNEFGGAATIPLTALGVGC